MTTEEFYAAVSEIRTAIKAGNSPMADRFKQIEALAQHPVANLDMLADLCLYEDLYDKTPYKIANTEYPIMNERMMDERGGRNTKAEAVEDEQIRKSSGQRRRRTQYENAWMDREVKSANKERRQRYNDFKAGKHDGVMTIRIADEGAGAE